MPLRNVWATPAARDATKERAAHAQCTTRRRRYGCSRSWPELGVEPEAAEDPSLRGALHVLKASAATCTAYLLEANLDAWIKENEARTRNGVRQDQRLLAASALYDVRVVVLDGVAEARPTTPTPRNPPTR